MVEPATDNRKTLDRNQKVVPKYFSKEDGFDGSTQEQLLEQYRSLVDFDNKEEKLNFKWVESFLKYQKKKHPTEDNRNFLYDAIDLHRKLFVSRRE